MLNRLFIAIGVLVILAIGAAFVVPRFVPWGDYRERIETLASEALGAPVRIKGDIQFALLPQPRLEFSKVAVGSEPAEVLKVERVEAEFSLLDFLRDQYVVTRLTLTAPEFDIVAGPAGTLVTGLQLTAEVAGTHLTIARATIAGGVARYTQYGAVEPVAVTAIDGELTMETLRGPFGFQGDGVINGADYGVRLSSGHADEGGATPVSLFVKAGDDSFTLVTEGNLTLADAPKFDGTLTLRQPPPKPINGAVADAGRGDLVLEGKLAATGERAILSNYVLSPDENRPGTRLTGAADLTLGAAPRFNAVMSGGLVTLPPRDATAELSDPPYELVRLLGEVPLPPIPTLPGKIGLHLDELNLRGSALKNIQLDARTDAQSWQIEGITATLAGNTALGLNGNLSVVDGKPIFAGRATAQTDRPDALALLWRKPGAGNPLFNVHAAFSSDITLSSDTFMLLGGKLEIGGASEAVDLEIGFAPTGRRLKLDTHIGTLSEPQAAMLAALLPDIAGDGSFAATFPKGEVSLGLERGTIYGIEAQDMALDASWEGGVLDVAELAAADFGGAEIAASFTAFGSVTSPELSGTATLKVASQTAPVLKAAFEALQTPPALQAAILRQLPADLAVRLDAPTGEGTQTLAMSGTAGATTVALDAKLGGGIVNTMRAPLHLSFDMTSGRPSLMTAQLGLARGELFPEDKPLHLVAQLEGSPTNSLETHVTLAGGEDIVSFAGNVVPTDPARLTGKGSIEASLGDPSAALATLGAGGIAVPPLKGRAVLDFAGSELLRLSAIEGQSGDAAFTGALALTRQDERAGVSGSLDFVRLEAKAVLPMLAGATGGTILSGGLWPDLPIDLGAVPRTVTGRVAINVDEVTAGGAPLLKDAAFDFDWDAQGTRVRGLQAEAGGGRLTLDTSICCAGALADKQFTGRITLSGVDIDTLLPPAMAAVLGGRIDASAQFDATGGSFADLMQVMTGSGSYTIADFRAERFDPNAFAVVAAFDNIIDIEPAALETAITEKVAEGPFTSPVFTGVFTIAGGVLRSPNLSLAGNAAGIFGGGSVHLADLTLDARYTMSPVAIVAAASGIDAISAEIGLDLSGPLWAPVATLDVSALANGMMIKASEIELARLEQLRIADEARQKAAAEEQARVLAEQQAAEAAAAQKAAEEAAAKKAAEDAAAASTPPPIDLGL